jgi:hypothetical protein
MPEIKVTVLELYDRVWARPTSVVAKELGISDRGLGKVCERHRIPVPGRGYWRRIETGQKPSRPSLPVGVNPDQAIWLNPAPPPPPAGELEHPLIEFERQPANRIVVPKRVRLTHRLIRDYRARWSKGSPLDWHGKPPALAVKVSPAQRRRALGIMQTLLTALEERGMAVAVTADRKTEAIVLGQRVSFRMIERQKQLLIPPDQRGSYGPPYRLTPAGTLALEIESAYWTKSRWADGSGRRLEDRLNEFIIGLVEAALKDQQLQRERQERERRWREEEHKREIQRERIRQLDEWLAAWRRCADVRAFVAAARVFMMKAGGDREEWLVWAEGYANSLDPFRSEP